MRISKKFHALALAVVFAIPSVARADEATEEAVSLNIVSWNIEWYPGKRRFARSPEMAAHAALVNPQLGEMNPDVFLAQEMRDWNAFALLTDEVDGLRPPDPGGRRLQRPLAGPDHPHPLRCALRQSAIFCLTGHP